MAVRHLYVDKTELVMMVPQKKKYISKNVLYSDIRQIVIKPCTERILLIPKESEKIEIYLNKEGTPVSFYKNQEKKFYDSYKKELEDFCKHNKIQFITE